MEDSGKNQQHQTGDVADGLRRWNVVGGLVIVGDTILLVANKRRNGSVDWSTPGGVVDPGETPLDALTREVEEETGLIVEGWTPALYHVDVVAPDAGFHLTVDAHRAESVTGEIRIDDPDGIVIAAEFVAIDQVAAHLADSSPWVSEPLVACLDGQISRGYTFRYSVADHASDDPKISRLDVFDV